MSPPGRAAHALDLDRLLERCHEHTWRLSDLDFSRPPQALPGAQEDAVVQYLTDFVYIERMAGSFFLALQDKVGHPVVRQILQTFVIDETRHAHAMQLLADHFDRRKLRIYAPNPWIVRLVQRLEEWIRVAPPDAAATAVTTGEICFDVAYLKPLDEHLADPTAREVLRLVHRDESRHLAIDYWLLEWFGTADYQERHPPEPFDLRAEAELMVRYVRAFSVGFPFMRQVFFGTNARLDQNGARLRDAAKRIQLAMTRPGIRGRPFVRFYGAVQAIFDSPVLGPVVRRGFATVLGADPTLFKTQYTDAERAHVEGLSAHELAVDTLAAFYPE